MSILPSKFPPPFSGVPSGVSSGTIAGAAQAQNIPTTFIEPHTPASADLMDVVKRAVDYAGEKMCDDEQYASWARQVFMLVRNNRVFAKEQRELIETWIQSWELLNERAKLQLRLTKVLVDGPYKTSTE